MKITKVLRDSKTSLDEISSEKQKIIGTLITAPLIAISGFSQAAASTDTSKQDQIVMRSMVLNRILMVLIWI